MLKVLDPYPAMYKESGDQTILAFRDAFSSLLSERAQEHRTIGELRCVRTSWNTLILHFDEVLSVCQHSAIISPLIVLNLLFAQREFCRIYIRLISLAQAYLYMTLTPTHMWHAATRHHRVNSASKQSKTLDGEGQVAQHWCACCYGD